mmetsp:Transcript_16556/g.19834  ORF Transcript_16556/g.19834 Transcript_16556/m.19834 type:complete len:515 (-) Transcript_16556:611-2155(-)|eukprot:CAMPEP_0204822334 /NCGR_PEP_ID=MMETSP1346-20131115/527_1 /ASSEMBLY_ACC=CAM_ASM_000771 /TAXON_ID=215587 /ORGANISM="Aplanochytrium stocchinoi, Strain GSBS06" /LENGTH=514 /DNA_ID=CAMNT_0051948497 /DNA_START=165 /DNA_END=1709 /DNA_ORIENTATION=+
MGNILKAGSWRRLLYLINRSAIFLVVLGIVRRYLRWKRDLANMRKLGLPILDEHNGFMGSVSALAKNYNRIYDFRSETHEKIGDTFVWVPPVWLDGLLVSTRDSAIVKHILNDEFDTFVKTDIIIDGFADLLGHGIFAINHGPHAKDKGDAWYFQRKTASRIFTKKQFTGHVHNTLVNNTNKIIRNIEEHIKSNEPEILMQRQFFKFTLDTIGDIGFGVDLDTLSKNDVPFSNAFDTAQKHIAQRASFRPGWEYLKWLYPAEREITKSIAVLDDFCYKIITDRLALTEEELSLKGDILSLFLKANNKLSNKYLRDIIMSFFIAGRDTTACTLSFTFMILSKHPEIQNKLFQEISSQNLKADNSNFITLDEVKEMKYLDGVIKECLRLFPPVPVDAKQCAEETVLPDGTVIPKGTRVAFEVYCMGRDPKVWKEPEAVIPERWYEKQPTQYEFPVFQAGPRICLGKDLAMYEAKFATVELLRRYRFELAEELTEPVYSPGITMTVKNGLKLKVFRR